MQKVFISYSRKDIDFARKLAGDLENAGYDVWWDITDLQGGDDWVRNIPDAIANSQFVMVVLSPNSIESEWVKKEYTQALTLKKKIIPIMFESCNVPFALNTINFVNFASGDYPENFKKLLAPLGFTGKPPVVAPYVWAARSIPPAAVKFGIPAAIIGLILLLAFIFIPRNKPSETPTVTPTLTPSTSPTASVTLEPSTATHTATSTQTITFTPTNTHTPSPTIIYEIRLPICITAESPNIYVRSGPGQTYVAKVLDLRDESGKRLEVCPWFTGQITSGEDIWLLVAEDQREATLQEFEGGWIRRDLLDKNISIDILPIVTLTSTPTPSDTPTITPSATPTLTPSPTSTYTPAPTETSTPTDTPIDIPTP
jgi:hypothetical protein